MTNMAAPSARRDAARLRHTVANPGGAEIEARVEVAPGMLPKPDFEEAVITALHRAKTSYEINGRRARLLGDGLFGDPAWEILLDLFISTVRGVTLSVTAVCIGSRTPTATAIRYIGRLCDAGLVVRVADARDGRRSHVRLTELGWTRMLALLLEDAPLP